MWLDYLELLGSGLWQFISQSTCIFLKRRLDDGLVNGLDFRYLVSLVSSFQCLLPLAPLPGWFWISRLTSHLKPVIKWSEEVKGVNCKKHDTIITNHRLVLKFGAINYICSVPAAVSTTGFEKRKKIFRHNISDQDLCLGMCKYNLEVEVTRNNVYTSENNNCTLYFLPFYFFSHVT